MMAQDGQDGAGREGTAERSRLGGWLAGASVRRPWLVIAATALLTLASLYVTLTRFQISTDTDALLRITSSWLTDKQAFIQAFPQFDKTIVAVVEGETPEATEAAASRLLERLQAEPGPGIRTAWRPDGGPFFDRNGLLLLPLPEVEAAAGRLAEQAPLLSALSGDPSLRGLMRLLELGATSGGLEQGTTLLRRFAEVIERTLKGERPRFSWQTALSGEPPQARQLRKFVLVDPVLNYEALEPAEVAIDRIREAGRDLGITPENGLRVRLTGAAPLADEEFATIEEGAPLHLGLTIVAIAVILWLAMRSGSLIAAVLVTTLCGLLITVALGLLTVGRFNVISVAVAALFLGLGIDFAIQFAVRYRDERHRLDDVRGALRATGRSIGWSLTLAAAALLAGFFSFLPTNFTGVSELGLITGLGMIVALLLSLTFLPAALAVLKPPGEPERVDNQRLAKVDHWIHAHRRGVIVASVLAVLAGAPALWWLHFDANPMHLRSAETEAVATFLDLGREPGMSPNTISIVAPSLEAARRLSERLAALPEVARVSSVLSFLPENADAKRAALATAAEALPDIVDPQPPAPPPSDAELVAALRRTAAALAAVSGDGEAERAARALAPLLVRLAEAPPERRQAAAAALAGTLPGLLAQIRATLRPEVVTIESLPDAVRRDWLAPDGRARIEVAPRGDGNDNAVLERFTEAVRSVAPNVTGAPVDVVESGRLIVQAFVTAAAIALVAVFVLLAVALRRPKDVALTLGPLVIATIATLEAVALIGMPLNLANIIALPLMLAVGVNFHIYYMIAWRDGMADMLASSLTRAIFFSSLTTGVAFGSLWLSNHPGTASMGKLLTLSLVFTLVAAFVVVPAFLGPPRQAEPKGRNRPAR